MNSGLKTNNPKTQKNRIVFLDKAQIAIDFLPSKDKEQIISTIKCLEDFPIHTKSKIYKLNPSIPNHFIARGAGDYRIVFKSQDREITIVDVVSRNRLESLFGSSKNY